MKNATGLEQLQRGLIEIILESVFRFPDARLNDRKSASLPPSIIVKFIDAYASHPTLRL